jgi:hypothetical protein
MAAAAGGKYTMMAEIILREYVHGELKTLSATAATGHECKELRVEFRWAANSCFLIWGNLSCPDASAH